MGDLFWNKVFGAILAVLLGVMALQLVSEMVFASEGEGEHNGEEEAASLNDWAHSRFAYYTDIAETSSAGDAPEEIYDLGALLAVADPSNGERTFKAKCTTCHTIDQGGPNGTGPNLHGILTATHAHKDDFGYSSAMQATAGKPWTYETIDHWLENPSSYIRGTTMAFAGLRRDDERANVIAFLAQNSPGAAAFPEPLPEEDTAPAEGDTAGGEAAVAPLDEETLTENPSEATGQIETIDSIDDTDQPNNNEGEVVLAPESEMPGSDTDDTSDQSDQ